MKYYCKNCRNEFEAEDAEACPKCHSKHLDKKQEDSKPTTEKKFYSSTGMVYGDTKQAWKSFHSQSLTTQCRKCGSEKFKNDVKHRERICSQCGEIYPLPRR
ncbi:hypothetical protein HUU53_00275 [Candidatus Micrarchaeota archaeon]|nr:hypothetical protein [Candidatus Micrarchaeota archaeon]